VRKLRFTHLTVDNEDATADSRYIDADISQVQLLRLHESNKSIVLSFSALNYASENSGTYSYRLRGLDKEWTQLPAGEHSVRYTSLPSGSFRLEVRYDSAYSDEESELLTLNIEVTPYFWHSWWFLSGLLILLVALASWLYRQRMMKLSARIKKEEERRLMEPIEKAVRESRNPEQMQARIQDILHIQQRLEESTNKTAEADNEEARLKEVPFMDRVMTIMEQNYKNSEFGVQQMCEAMGMSRSLLSKRLNVETGMPASQFIRNYRLNIAHELLQRKNQSRNVADIAFSVGFNDPKYFTRCFHRQYGVPPSSFTQSAGE
jgi:AraC-like DNA-binding protein